MKNLFFGKAFLIITICIALASCSDNDEPNLISGEQLPAGNDSISLLAEIKNSELVFVDGGSFLMGAQAENPNEPNYDSQANKDESPVHQVSVSPFYIMKNEVTQALWEYVMTNADPDSIEEEKYLYPITNVSYETIVNEFIPRLNNITGIAYRLPTEAEWEYAARGGQKDEYTHSMGQTGEYLKFAGSNNASDVASFKLSKVAQIGTKASNALGLYDMSGNICEWCYDWYSEDCSTTGAINPQGATNGTKRVVRGGSWELVNDSYCRVSYKSAVTPNHMCDHIGFRLVVSAK